MSVFSSLVFSVSQNLVALPSPSSKPLANQVWHLHLVGYSCLHSCSGAIPCGLLQLGCCPPQVLVSVSPSVPKLGYVQLTCYTWSHLSMHTHCLTCLTVHVVAGTNATHNNKFFFSHSLLTSVNNHTRPQKKTSLLRYASHLVTSSCPQHKDQFFLSLLILSFFDLKICMMYCLPPPLLHCSTLPHHGGFTVDNMPWWHMTPV